jgi:NAD(P)-dependent dehydrogenase (short-subunit alcohol dehydrogenase family)
LNRIDPMTTTILITGTNRGIGLEMAKQALAKGWTVYGSARQAKSPIRTRISAIIRTSTISSSTSPTIRGDAGGGGRAIDAPIDILINNAGIIGPERQSTLDMDFDGFAKTLAVNTLAPLAVSAGLPAASQAQLQSAHYSPFLRRWAACPMPSPTGSPTGHRKQRSTR